MPLIQCRECQWSVSSYAKTCPNCGARVPRSPVGCAVAAGLLGLLLTVGMCSTRPPSNSPPAPPPKIVSNSAWDGSVHQVTAWLDKNLKDPDSFEAIEWGKVVKVPAEAGLKHRYWVRCKYRAKNSFGGYVIEHKVFLLNASGDVIGTRGWGE